MTSSAPPSVGSSEEEKLRRNVEKISLIDIPVIVDFKDLGDKEKGHLIGEAGQAILARVMKDLPAGRYSKKEISKKIFQLKNPAYTKTQIREALPYIPGMIKDYGYNIRIVSERPKPDRVNEHELCLFMSNLGRVYYVVKDEKGVTRENELLVNKNIEESERQVLFQRINDVNKDALAARQYYEDELGKIQEGPDAHESNNKRKKLRMEKDRLNGILISTSLSDDPEIQHIQNKLFEIAVANKDIPEPILTAAYTGKSRRFGVGGFGKVIAGFNIFKKEWDVIKVQKPEEDALVSSYVAEAKALVKVGLGHGMVIKRKKHSFFKKPVDQYNVVINYAKGLTLKEYLLFNQNVSLALLLDISLKITQKLKEIHGHHYLHCDLKMDNILYNPVTGEVSIIDLGFVLQTSPNEGEPKAYSEFHGAPEYAAPELDDREGIVSEYTEQTEVYALGVCLKKMFGLSSMSVEILNGLFAPMTVPCKIYQTSFEEFIHQMTEDAPSERPSLSTVSDRLKKLRDDMLPVYPRVLGMLNISDYAKCSDMEKMKLIYALRSVDVVVLIDNGHSNMSTLEVSKIRKELMGHKLFVEKELYKSNDPSALVNQIKEDYHYKKGGEIRAIDHLCYIHPEHSAPMLVDGVDSVTARNDAMSGVTKIRSRTGIVSEDHLNLVLGKLDEHIKRFQTKSAPEKLKVLQDAHKKIESYKGKNVTYIQLFNDLEQLERSIVKERWAPMFRSTQERLKGIQSVEATIQRDIEIKRATGAVEKLNATPRPRRG